MKGSLDEAHDHLARAAQADPRSPTAQVALARLELVRKNYPAVLEHSNAALAIRQNDATARLFHVIGLTGTHSYGAAKTEAEQLARDTKDAPQVEMQLGIIALGQGHYAEAEELFRKLYKGSTDLQPLTALVNTYEAEHKPDRALALMRRNTEVPGFKGKGATRSNRGRANGKNEEALSPTAENGGAEPEITRYTDEGGTIEQKNDNLPEACKPSSELASWRQIARIDRAVASLEDQQEKDSKPSPTTERRC